MLDARKLKDEAAAAAAKGRYRKAAELYAQIARIEPDDGQWPHREGEAWKRAGDKGAAVEALTTAADGYARTGFFLKAISVAKMILEIDPGRTETQGMLAALYARRDGRGSDVGALRGGPPAPPGRSPLAPRPLPGDSIPLPPDPLLSAPPPPFAAPQYPAPPPPRAVAPQPPPLPTPRPAPPSRPDYGAPIALPDFGDSVADPEHSFDRAMDEPDLVPIDLAGFGAPPTSPMDAPELRPTGASGPLPTLDLDMPLNQRIPGARISQSFRIPVAFEIPIDDSAMPAPPLSPSDLPQIPLFSSLDETRLHRLIQSARVVRCQPGQVVVRQGERGDALYVVVHGTMAVRVDGAPEPVAHLGEGQFFGELALLSSEPRLATVQAETEAEVIEIRRDVVWELIEESPDVLPVLLRFFRDRLIERLISTSPLFAPFSGDEGRQLAERFHFLELRAGAHLVHEGQRAEGLFVVLLGRCEVVVADVGTVATIGPGDLVGEISLLTRGPATATVTAVTPVWALAMPREVFQEVILTHPQVLIYVNDVAEQRRSSDSRRIDMI